VDQPSLAAGLRAAAAQAIKVSGETRQLLARIADLEAEVSRLRKLVVPFSWNPISILFTQGTASSVNLAAFLRNPDNRSITYSAIGSLPTGVTLSGSVVSYNGSGSTANTSVQFRASSGPYTAESASTVVAISGAPAVNTEPVWRANTPAGFTYTQGTGGTVFLAPYGFDAEGDPFEFYRTGSAVDTAPGSVSVATDGLLTIPSTLSVGAYPFEVDVRAVLVSVPGNLPTLTLSNGGTGKPWTVGHAFKRGDVIAGRYLYATATNGLLSGVQAVARNYWSDGSLKFAVISGVGASEVQLGTTTTIPFSGEVALSSSPASVTFTGGITGTYACPTTDTVGTWNKSSAHLARKISGTVMTERHYYVPTSDAHVAVWFYVRSYTEGSIEVETVVENGWLNLATPTAKAYSVNVSVGGSSRYSGSLTHYHHSRWSRVDWVGTDPAITPVHNVAYLKSSKVVPNFSSFGTATDFAYNTTSAPFTTGNWRTNWHGGGDGVKDQIGLLPPWEALHLTTGNATTYASTLANARLAGGLPAHYRDETTGRPFLFTAYPTLSKQNSTLPAETGGVLVDIESGYPAAAHSPAMGYYPYLLTGRWNFLEETQFWAQNHWLGLHPTYQGTGTDRRWFGDQTRAVAWALRQVAMATTVTPDSDTLKAQFTALLNANLDYTNTNSVASGTYYTPLGIINPPPLDADGRSNTYLDCAPWQDDFLAASLGFAYDMEATTSASLVAVRDHAYKFIVGRLTTPYEYRRVAQYRIPVASPENYIPLATYFTTFAQVYSGLVNELTLNDGSLAGTALQSALQAGDAITDDWTYGYLGAALAACSYAVSHNAPGASAAYSRLTGSSSYALTSAYADYPKWGVTASSTSVASTLATTGNGLPANAWSSNLGNSSLNTQTLAGAILLRPLEAHDNASVAVLTNWSSKGTFDPTAGRLIWSGARAGVNAPGYPYGQRMVQYDETADTWTAINDPFGANISHGFDSQDINVSGRRYYRSIGSAGIGQWNLDTNAYIGLTTYQNPGFSTFPMVAYMANVNKVFAWYARSGGKRVAFDVASQTMGAESVVTNYTDLSGVTGNACYVSAAGKVLFGIAGATSCYTFDGTTETAAATAPVVFGTQEESVNHCLLVAHPTEAAALMFAANGNVYKYTFGTNTWSTVSSIPSGIYDTLSVNDRVSRTFATTIPAHGSLSTGVIALVGYRGASSVFALYKP
jgi:hypothetical protein